MSRQQPWTGPFPLPQDPVFIVGYPRSGTTLLQRLLAAQPGFFSLPETHYFSVIERRIGLLGGEALPPAGLDSLWPALRDKMELELNAQEADLLARSAGEGTLNSKAIFEFIVRKHLAPQLAERDPGPAWRWVEKTPTHANFLPRILGLYARAQVLHIVRHPVPAVVSRRRKFPYNRETPLAQLAQAWQRLEKNVCRGRELFPGRIHSLRYEDLAADVAGQMRAVGAFLGAAWDEKRFDLLPGPGGLAAIALPSEEWKRRDAAGAVVDTNDSYRGTLAPEDIQCIEEAADESMRRHGYGHFSDPA